MVRTLKLDEEIDKTQGKINALQFKNFEIGLSRKETFQLNFLQYKLKQLGQIETSEEKYNPKEDEKIIKSTFFDYKW